MAVYPSLHYRKVLLPPTQSKEGGEDREIERGKNLMKF